MRFGIYLRMKSKFLAKTGAKKWIAQRVSVVIQIHCLGSALSPAQLSLLPNIGTLGPCLHVLGCNDHRDSKIAEYWYPIAATKKRGYCEFQIDSYGYLFG